MLANPQNVSSLKNSNRARILDCIRRQPISRADISRQLGLTKSAVTMLTNEMMGEGLLYEAGLAQKSSAPGRTSILLDIVADYAYAVGIMLHRRTIEVCITDLKLCRLAGEQQPTAVFSTPDEVLAWIETTVHRLLNEQKLTTERCVGIGISSPGPLDCVNGVILEPPDFPLFHRYPLVQRMRERFSCPVFLENNAVALALTNFYIQNTPGNTLFVVVADGIGSALLQDGRIFRGSQGYAGELGHVSIDPNGQCCSCGNRGCLEQYATLQAMKERFGFERYDVLVDRAEQGDETAQAVREELVTRIGAALVNSVNLFDVDTVILFGEYAYHADELTRRVEAYIARHSLICRVHPIEVIPSVLTLEDVGVVPAITALNAFFAQENRI